jgi:hypothetical protein
MAACRLKTLFNNRLRRPGTASHAHDRNKFFVATKLPAERPMRAQQESPEVLASDASKANWAFSRDDDAKLAKVIRRKALE